MTWRGTYRSGKWYSQALIEPLGLRKHLRYTDAVIDTGSPITVLPGICPVADDEAPAEAVSVRIRVGVDEWTEAPLAPRGRIFRFGGIGGAKLDRYVFLADFLVEGLTFPDLAAITFLDPDELHHPIISISDIAAGGGSVEFGIRGIRMGHS